MSPIPAWSAPKFPPGVAFICNEFSELSVGNKEFSRRKSFQINSTRAVLVVPPVHFPPGEPGAVPLAAAAQAHCRRGDVDEVVWKLPMARRGVGPASRSPEIRCGELPK